MRSLSLLLCLVPSVVFAWGSDGHMQIADIAWTKLTPTAKAKITTLLNAGEPSFRILNNDSRDAFRSAATFCDYMKSHEDTIYESIIPAMNSKFNPNIASIGREGSRCKTWHYYDVPIRYSGQEPAIDPSNADAALNLAIAELSKMNKSGLSDPKMACWWLYWIEHVTGDLHQPLHCVSSYEYESKGDAGGNFFKIKKLGGEGTTNLHSFWDGGIGRAIGEEREKGKDPNVEKVTDRWTGDSSLQPPADQVKDLDPMDWIKIGSREADKVVYGDLKQGDAPDMNYLYRMSIFCRKQAVLGGYRLAAVLNKALG
ncbi:MAG: S1/P1 nuclease [Armatimonadetes bacterium]|nr:S1/P1 nuclease [Armatimonadota bacterium]